MNWIIYCGIGLVAGLVGGTLGLGGGIILVPALVLLLGLSQHDAQGTALATMIPPIGLLAAMKYYANGHVKVSIAIFICIGFFVGGYFGASIAEQIPEHILRKFFGCVLLLSSLRLILLK